MIKHLFYSTLAILLFSACSNDRKLKHYGVHDVNDSGDTIYHKIPDFTFLNQDSVTVSQKDLSDYIYVTDFFFIDCPSICPIMSRNLLQVHEKFKDESRLKIVSHTLAPKYDTPSRLREFAKSLSIDTNQWIFLWGSKSDIYEIAEDYYIAAVENKEVRGGIDHSGKLVLIDKEGTIRGFYEGTQDYGIEQLMKDIPVLLAEYE